MTEPTPIRTSIAEKQEYFTLHDEAGIAPFRIGLNVLDAVPDVIIYDRVVYLRQQSGEYRETRKVVDTDDFTAVSVLDTDVFVEQPF